MAAFVDPNNVDRLRQVEDIATDLNLIGGPVLGDRPTSIFRRLRMIEAVSAEIDAWGARPDALYVETFCEAIGWVSD